MDIDERARKNVAALLQGVATAGLTPIAEYIGVDESTVSRMKNADFERVSKVLACCDLKIVPTKMQCYKPETIASYQHLAREYLNLPLHIRESVEGHGSGVPLQWE